jgi:hypothetical protein
LKGAVARNDTDAAEQYAARMMQAAWRGRAARKEAAARRAAALVAKAGFDGRKAVEAETGAGADAHRAAAKIQVGEGEGGGPCGVLSVRLVYTGVHWCDGALASVLWSQ